MRLASNDYGTINLPQHDKFIRKCNFKILHQQESEHIWIQYQEPVTADKNYLPMYPVAVEKNTKTFIRYLEEICETNICPIGRLGLYKYLDMDQAVGVAFDMLFVIENYPNLSAGMKFQKIKNILEKY